MVGDYEDHLDSKDAHRQQEKSQEKYSSTLYQTKILTLLGRCYLEIGAYEDSQELLEKAIDMFRAQEIQEGIEPV